MEKYYKRKSNDSQTTTGKIEAPNKSIKIKFNVSELPSDPSLRIPILEYHSSIQDQVRRAYLQRGPCQPRDHKFPSTQVGCQSKRFVVDWFVDYPTWLEYSIAKDAVFCLCCYLFKPNSGEQGGGDSFVGKGFTNFKKKDRLWAHVGDHLSVHNQAWKKCEDLMNQDQHIQAFFVKQSEQARREYRSRLNASTDCVRFLLRQGLAFRGDDESESSSNRGNFLELLRFLSDHNDDIKAATLENAPENLKLTSSDIKKDIVRAAAI